ncbi:MAG TPA: hypothetical protein VKV32_10005 [Stellaceae bacterium]|nr:hypothetical protein [Stellaceae bacterium]
MEDTLFRGNREPTLDEILAEPIVKTVMKRDRIDEDTVRTLMRRVKPMPPPKLRYAPPQPPSSAAQVPQASIGVLAQAVAAPSWPRVFPSL